jgi:hypothetical protein
MAVAEQTKAKAGKGSGAAPEPRYASRWGVSYKTYHVPRAVLEELRDAAESLEIPIKRAFAALLAPPADEAVGESREQAWINSLCRTIGRGHERAIEFVMADGAEAGETLSLHLPADYRQKLREAATARGVNATAAGRLILVAYAGRLREVIAERIGGGE